MWHARWCRRRTERPADDDRAGESLPFNTERALELCSAVWRI